MTPTLLLKFGTSCLMQGNWLYPPLFDKVASQLEMIRSLFAPIIVTSGAIQAGREYARTLKLDPDKFSKSQLAGMGGDIYGHWKKAFAFRNRATSVMLLSSYDLSHNMDHIRNCLNGYNEQGVVPLVNANDITKPEDEIIPMEHNLSENDFLTARLQEHVRASIVYFATETGGVYDRDIKNPMARLIPELTKAQYELLRDSDQLVGTNQFGHGGMDRKLEAAFSCCSPYTRVIIGPPGGIYDLIASKPVGTRLVV